MLCSEEIEAIISCCLIQSYITLAKIAKEAKTRNSQCPGKLSHELAFIN